MHETSISTGEHAQHVRTYNTINPNMLFVFIIINPRRACAARILLLGLFVSCLSVCLSVYIRSRTTGYETGHE